MAAAGRREDGGYDSSFPTSSGFIDSLKGNTIIQIKFLLNMLNDNGFQKLIIINVLGKVWYCFTALPCIAVFCIALSISLAKQVFPIFFLSPKSA